MYFIHQRKEWMYQGEALDFLRHLYAHRRSSVLFPRTVLPDWVGGENLLGGPCATLQELERRVNLVKQAEANFRCYQVKYEVLHRCPASIVWARNYLKHASKKMSEPMTRDNTVYFKREGAGTAEGIDSDDELDEDFVDLNA